jgi:uncharacterized protein
METGLTPFSAPEDTIVASAATHLGRLFAKAGVCESHGISHARNVERLADAALACHRGGPLTAKERLAVRLAALLHDADDRKTFPTHDANQNAQEILSEMPEHTSLQCSRAALVGLVLRMIDLVSASKNGDRVPDDARASLWMLYPRHADRLTALGWTGVYRCWKYNLGVKLPLFTATTPRARTEDELWLIAAPARYTAYRGDCESMIDHYYDKLLHIGRAIEVQENSFLAQEARKRLAPLIEVALHFGVHGTLDSAIYTRATALAEKEMRGDT